MVLKQSTIAKAICIYGIVYTTMRSLIGSIVGGIGNALFIGSVLLGIVMYMLYYKRMAVKIRKNTFFLLFALLLILFSFSILIFKRSSTYALYEYILYFMFFFFWFYVLNSVSIEWIAQAYALVSVIVSTQAIWEYVTGNILFRVAYTGQQLIRRAFGLVGSPLTLGMLLACTSLICLALAIKKSKVYYIAFILNVGGLLCTQSRGPLAAFIVGMFLLLFFNDNVYDRKRNLKILKRISLVVIVFLALWGIITVLSNYNQFINTIYRRFLTILEWGSTNASNYERSQRWRNAYNLFKENPVFGYGISSTGPHASTGIITESGILKVLVEVGVVGFLLYYGTLISCTLPNLKIVLRNRDKYASLAISVLAAIFIENIVLQIVESVTAFFLLSLFCSYLLYKRVEIRKQN